jgi:hypothetical protein
LNVLEEKLKESEQHAFSFEARAAELELQLLLGQERESSQQEQLAQRLESQEKLHIEQSNYVLSIESERDRLEQTLQRIVEQEELRGKNQGVLTPVVSTGLLKSTAVNPAPSLKLLDWPLAIPRISREGYTFMLIAVRSS